MKRFCNRCNATFDTDAPSECHECGAPRPETDWPRDRRLGEVVAGGQYRIVRRLGSGGFGSVYLVETVVGGLRRALKVLHAQWAADAEARKRFVNEALVLEEVNHPNVARCYAAGTLEGEDELYLLFELVEGVPLSRVIRPDEGASAVPLSPARAVNIAKQVASGLAVAHAKKVLHRDLKPENILIVSPGRVEEQVKLVDFGIAKSIDRGAESTARIVGTPFYMSPEQLKPGEKLDNRLDLWQLGAVLFVMLTGKLPYNADSGAVHELMSLQEQRLDAGPAPSEVDSTLTSHPALDKLVSRLLATNRDRRPRSASQVCQELARIEHRLVPTTGASTSLALLEALCATPSDGAWWALCRYLSGPDIDSENLVGTADALLGDWPDDLRQAPARWWETVQAGEDHRLWPLVRSLDLARRGLGDEEVMQLAASPAMSTITSLTLADNQISGDGAAALAASNHLEGLRRLDLGRNRIGSKGIESLAASDRLTHLESLSLDGNGLGARGAEALASARFRVKELDLSDNDIQASGVSALAASASLGCLECLKLRGNTIGSDGVGAIATSRTLTELQELDLSQNGIGPSGGAALALSANVGRLHAFSLAQNDLGVKGLELLLSSNRFGALEVLDLSSNDFGAQGAMVLASSPFARRLKRLDIADNRLGDAGLAAFLGAPHLSGLRVLSVAQNDITGAGATLLGGAPPELEELDASRNDLGVAGGVALAAALPRMGLKTLRVSGCGLEGEALSRVLSGGGGRLRVLSAASNALGSTGAESLAAVAEAVVLEGLDLSDNDLGVTGVELIGGSPHFKNLRQLWLDSNALGDDEGTALVKALEALPNLEELHLQDNGLGTQVAVALAASALAARLCRLDLAHNRLGDAGATALAQGQNWHVLHELDLERNDIGLGAAATVLSAPGMALLRRGNLRHNALGGRVDLHSIARDKVALLEESFALVNAERTEFAERFYGTLFSRFPSVKPLFAHVSMRQQQQHLMTALVTVIDNLRTPDVVAQALVELGERHVDYGAFPSHYYAVTSCLLDTLKRTLGDRWTDEIDDAWHEGLEAVTSVMLEAHAQTATGGERSRVNGG